MTQKRSDEDKIVFEEAVMGALIAAGIAGAVVAAFLPTQAVAGVLHAFGWVDQPSAYAWAYANWRLAMFCTAFLGLSMAAAAAAGFWFMGWQPTAWHHEGNEFIDDLERARRTLQAHETALFSEAEKAGSVSGITLGGVQFSRTRECAHIAIAGLPGAGKTVVMNALLLQIRERGDRIILHDVKGDFTAWLYQPGEVVLLGPWDQRASWWDIASDITTPEQATNFAGQLFPEPAGGSDPIFARAARALVAGLIQSYMAQDLDWSWDTLAADLIAGPKELIAKAHAANPITRQLIDKNPGPNDRTAKSFMAQIATGTDWIPAYAAAFDLQRDDAGRLDRSGSFSLSGWIFGTAHQQVQTVILNNNLDYRERAAQIFGSLLAAAAVKLNSPSMPEVSTDAAGIWFLLDEYPKLGTTAAAEIQAIEELGRSRGIRVVKAVQDDSQLFAAMGREKGEAQRSVQQTRIYCKLAPGSADELSRRLGTRQIKRIKLPQSVARGNKASDDASVPVLRPEEVSGLRVIKDDSWPGSGVELIVHADATLVKMHQPFPVLPPREKQAAQIIESARWRRGILLLSDPEGATFDAARMFPTLLSLLSPTGPKAPIALEDDDLPFALETLGDPPVNPEDASSENPSQPPANSPAAFDWRDDFA